MLENVSFQETLYAIIVRSDYRSDGINFFTPDDFSQQLAHMEHKSGKIIDPHFHNQVERSVNYTQEVLFIKSGILRVDFYDKTFVKVGSRDLFGGDVILLCSGGHGFEVIEDVRMIEVKQGPYCGDADKTRFEPEGI